MELMLMSNRNFGISFSFLSQAIKTYAWQSIKKCQFFFPFSRIQWIVARREDEVGIRWKNCELRGCHALHRLQNRCQSYIVSRIASMKKQHDNETNLMRCRKIELTCSQWKASKSFHGKYWRACASLPMPKICELLFVVVALRDQIEKN